MLSYKMSILNLHKQRWTTYLHSGTGQLEKSHPARRHDEKTALHYWPTYLHSFTMARAFAKRMTGDAMDHEMRAASAKGYLSYLEEQVHEYFDVIITLMKHDYMHCFMQLQYLQEKPLQEHIHKGQSHLSTGLQARYRCTSVLLLPRGCLRQESTEAVLADGSQHAQYHPNGPWSFDARHFAQPIHHDHRPCQIQPE